MLFRSSQLQCETEYVPTAECRPCFFKRPSVNTLHDDAGMIATHKDATDSWGPDANTDCKTVRSNLIIICIGLDNQIWRENAYVTCVADGAWRFAVEFPELFVGIFI